MESTKKLEVFDSRILYGSKYHTYKSKYQMKLLQVNSNVCMYTYICTNNLAERIYRVIHIYFYIFLFYSKKERKKKLYNLSLIVTSLYTLIQFFSLNNKN